jgi:hypothetical protein
MAAGCEVVKGRKEVVSECLALRAGDAMVGEGYAGRARTQLLLAAKFEESNVL